MLDVVIYYRQPQSPQGHAKLFAEGLARHGIKAEFRTSGMYRRCDLAVFWAHKNVQVIHAQRSAGLDYLVMERGYFGDRFAMTSLGYNGLNGHAQFHNANMPSDRWRRYGVELKPWKTDGDIIVLMGQVPTDASLRNCDNYKSWVVNSAYQAQRLYGKRVYFRGHPHPAASNFRPDLPTLTGTLEEALSDAAAVITWNSNSGVDAVLAGVPLIACDRGSMAYTMAAQKIGDPLVRPDRSQWVNDLAYTQWTDGEISTGEAWSHLRQHFDTKKTVAA